MLTRLIGSLLLVLISGHFALAQGGTPEGCYVFSGKRSCQSQFPTYTENMQCFDKEQCMLLAEEVVCIDYDQRIDTYIIATQAGWAREYDKVVAAEDPVPGKTLSSMTPIVCYRQMPCTRPCDWSVAKQAFVCIPDIYAWNEGLIYQYSLGEECESSGIQ